MTPKPRQIPRPPRPAKPNAGFAAHFFPGTDPYDTVLIVAGLHTSEQSGVEVAHWIRVALADRPKPTRPGVILIPEVFPNFGKQARAVEWAHSGTDWGKFSDDFREYPFGKTGVRYPNRQFPPPGQSLAGLLNNHTSGTLEKLDGNEVVDDDGTPMTLLPQIKQLIRLIECHRPIRIVSLHGIHRSDNDAKTPEAGHPKAGIFVDPRYSIPKEKRKTANYDLEGFKFDTSRDPGYPPVKDKDGNPIAKQFNSAWTPQGRDDDAFALEFAKAVGDPSLVPANHLENENIKGKTPSVHYKKSTDNPPGFSLGDWAPVDGPDGRPGVPVFTVEPDMDFESWAFLDGVQYMTGRGKDMVRQPYTAKQIRPLRYIEARATSLRAYANAVIDIGLG